MKLSEQQQKAQQFLLSIYRKVWESDAFRQNLIENPIETLNAFTKKVAKFPSDKKLIVEDQSNPNHIYLNLPAKPNFKEIELNEEQIETIAGGGYKPWQYYLTPIRWVKYIFVG